MNAKKTIKVYETSIVAPGNKMEPVREAKLQATTMQIEVLHFAIFMCVIGFLFGGMWRAAVRREKSLAKNATPVASAQKA